MCLGLKGALRARRWGQEDGEDDGEGWGQTRWARGGCREPSPQAQGSHAARTARTTGRAGVRPGGLVAPSQFEWKIGLPTVNTRGSLNFPS